MQLSKLAGPVKISQFGVVFDQIIISNLGTNLLTDAANSPKPSAF